MIVVKCPNCNGEIRVEDNQKLNYCIYCGTKIYFSDDRFEESKSKNDTDDDLDAEYDSDVKSSSKFMDEFASRKENLDLRGMLGFFVISIIISIFVGIMGFYYTIFHSSVAGLFTIAVLISSFFIGINHVKIWEIKAGKALFYIILFPLITTFEYYVLFVYLFSISNHYGEHDDKGFIYMIVFVIIMLFPTILAIYASLVLGSGKKGRSYVGKKGPQTVGKKRPLMVGSKRPLSFLFTAPI